LEVHGPCLVSNFSAADCSASLQTAVPITQFFYWQSNDGTSNANKLKKVSRFTSNGGPSNCSGYSTLDTTYDSYDERGNPAQITDTNGVVSTYSYEENRVVSSTVAGKTTRYSYDNAKLTTVQY